MLDRKEDPVCRKGDELLIAGQISRWYELPRSQVMARAMGMQHSAWRECHQIFKAPPAI